MTRPAPSPVRVGISHCLLGAPVRHDGGHKLDAELTDALGSRVEWVPLCPEVEANFGVPRDAMHLADDAAAPRLLTVPSRRDMTDRMRRYTVQRLRDLRTLNLSGCVFKSRSPSCGIRDVPVFTRDSNLLGHGRGLFAEAFQQAFPLMPVEDEERLRDRSTRDHFLERVFGYHRRQCREEQASPPPSPD